MHKLATTEPVSRLFLSYARADEGFARWLYERLTGAGFKVWWDLVSMPSRSLTFLHEIREAIQDCDRMVVVLGPVSLSSDYVRAEWQHALANDKIVVPVLRAGTFDDLPAELHGLHQPDFRSDAAREACLAELIRILRQPAPPLGDLNGQVPAIPPHFQPRPEDSSRLASLILQDRREPVTISAQGRVVVVHGMAGVGKSVLAATFARATTTRGYFPDGVWWITVGSERSATEVLRGMGQLLGDDPQLYLDAISGETRLWTLLGTGTRLLVLDDVWDVEQVAPLQRAAGVNHRLLITARDAGLATALAAREQLLDVLTEEAALRYLSDWSGQSPETIPPKARKVADACGRLPLALALNGAMVRDGSAWSDLLAALQEADLRYAEHPLADYPHRTVRSSIEVSLETLARRNPEGAARYRELAAFEWSSGVSEAAIAALWNHLAGLPEREARKLLVTLEAKALLLRGEVDARAMVTLHNLLLDYLQPTTADAGRLNDSVLESYRAQAPAGWVQVPDDGYIHQHLAHHLAKARRYGELYALLSESPAWMEAKYRSTGSHQSLVQDVEIALRGDPDPLHVLGLGAVRCNAYHSTVSYGDAELALLVALGRIQEARNAARLRPSVGQRISGGLAIHHEAFRRGSASTAILAEIEVDLPSISDNIERDWARCQVADAFAAAGEADHAIALCQGIGHGLIRAAARQRVAVSLSKAKDERAKELLEEAQRLVDEVPWDDLSGERQPAVFHLVEALAATWHIGEAASWADTLVQYRLGFEDELQYAVAAYAEIVKRLVSGGYMGAMDYLQQARSVLWQMQTTQARLEAKACLAKALFTPRDTEVNGLWTDDYSPWIREPGEELLDSAFAEYAGLTEPADRAAGALYLIDAYVYGGLFEKANECLSTLEEPALSRARRIVAAGLAQAGRFDESAATARSIQEPKDRAGALTQLALHVAEHNREWAAALLGEVVVAHKPPLVSPTRAGGLCSAGLVFLRSNRAAALEVVSQQLTANLATLARPLWSLLLGFLTALEEQDQSERVDRLFAAVTEPELRVLILCGTLAPRRADHTVWLNRALDIVRGLPEGPLKAWLTADIAAVREQRGEDAVDLFNDAASVLQHQIGELDFQGGLDPDEVVRLMPAVEAKLHLIGRLVSVRREDQAITLVSAMGLQVSGRERAAEIVVRSLSARGEVERARAAMRACAKGDPQVLRAFFDQLIADGRLEQAEQELASLETSVTLHIEIRCRMALALASSRRDRAIAHLSECASLASSLAGEDKHGLAVCMIAFHWAQVERASAEDTVSAAHSAYALFANRPSSTFDSEEASQWYVRLLVVLGEYERARAVARALPRGLASLTNQFVNRNANEALAVVARGLVEAGQFAAAEEVIYEILGDDALRSEIRNAILREHLHAKDLKRATDRIAGVPPSEYIAFVANWEKFFESVQPGLALAAALEVIRIAGCCDTHWREVSNAAHDSDLNHRAIRMDN